jgi:hypothetical protein
LQVFFKFYVYFIIGFVSSISRQIHFYESQIDVRYSLVKCYFTEFETTFTRFEYIISPGIFFYTNIKSYILTSVSVNLLLFKMNL